MGFVVRKKSANSNSFYLLEESWDAKTKKKFQKTVPKEAYYSIGFAQDMTLEEARRRASQLNKQNQLDVKKRTATIRRLNHEKEVNSAYLPPHLVSSFEQELNDNYADNIERLNNILKQWSVVQKMISTLELDAKNFFNERQKFYNYYRKKAWSPDYIKKLNRLANLWGQFCSRRNNFYYQDIPKISSTLKEKISEIRDITPGLKTPSEGLSWDDLRNQKSTFENRGLIEKYNWMFIGLWFGLRPKEIDQLKSKINWRLETDVNHNVKVIQVYQSKLTGLTKDKRWKTIPVYFKEQEEALKLIYSGNFERPLNKTLKSIFGVNSKIETYSPRKGFTDLMLNLGFELEDISIFLGHADISMTWKHYKNKKLFKLPLKKAV